MDLTLIQYLLIVVGGFLAGIMNTLAGYGSLITLSLLMDVIGLPADMANGTNRVNVLSQCTASSIGYIKGGKVQLRKYRWIILAMVLGATAGIFTVLQVDNQSFRSIFRYLIILLFFIILINPKRWMREQSEESTIPLPIRLIAFFALGFYGGFIQMGMGIFFLASMIFLERSTLLEGNGAKVAIVAIYTIVAVAIFHFNGLINWQAGMLIAISQSIGGYLTAKYASQSPNANKWAYYVLVAIVLIVIVYQFGVK